MSGATQVSYRTLQGDLHIVGATSRHGLVMMHINSNDISTSVNVNGNRTNISIHGLGDFIRHVDKATSEQALRPAFNRVVNRLLGLLRNYPPELPNQTYRRTGNLGRAWKGKVWQGQGMSKTMRGEVRNSLRYARFVQGDNRAGIHTGRWINAEEAVKFLQPQIDADFKQAVELGIRRN